MLDEVLHTGRVALVALVAAVVVVVVATVALARDEVAMMTVSAGRWGAGQLAIACRRPPPLLSARDGVKLLGTDLFAAVAPHEEAESARQAVSFVLC